jgi:hypothetical protein
MTQIWCLIWVKVNGSRCKKMIFKCWNNNKRFGVIALGETWDWNILALLLLLAWQLWKWTMKRHTYVYIQTQKQNKSQEVKHKNMKCANKSLLW